MIRLQIAAFAQHIPAGDTDESRLTLVIDGFTRFSAEEEYLVGLLHRERCGDWVIGTLCQPKSRYRAAFRESNLYQASVDFLRKASRGLSSSPTISRGSKMLSDYFKVLRALIF